MGLVNNWYFFPNVNLMRGLGLEDLSGSDNWVGIPCHLHTYSVICDNE